MNMDKFTERSRGFLQAAQTIAIREGNQRVVPEHLLKALMDDDQGLAANLIGRAGGDAAAVRRAASKTGGHATLIRAPAAVRAAVEVFEPQGGALAGVSKRVKESFDPKGVLNPGRMWAGV